MPEPTTSLEDEAPLFFAIKRDPTKMSDAELTLHLNDLRALKGSAPTRRARVNKKATPKSKVDFDALFKPKA